jgi:hypothetical protein
VLGTAATPGGGQGHGGAALATRLVDPGDRDRVVGVHRADDLGERRRGGGALAVDGGDLIAQKRVWSQCENTRCWARASGVAMRADADTRVRARIDDTDLG